MKILYAIQGTGNGHISRATEIIPILKELADVDILVSGIQADIVLPFNVKYKLYGLSFIFGKKGGVDLWKTMWKSRFFRCISDVRSLPVNDYDLIINDFEPVSAWACKLKGKNCIGLSHQNAVLHPMAPKPAKKDFIGDFILRNYAPATEKYGFHFHDIGDYIFPPVIRHQIRNSEITNKAHYTVYLPAYSDDEIICVLGKITSVQWEVFSKHTEKEYDSLNVKIRKVSADGFTRSFISCEGILCTAGFETPAEALWMGKKLCVIPMKNQYEQACNAEFLKSMGILVLKHLKNNEQQICSWIENDNRITVNYPDQTRKILVKLVAAYSEESKLPYSYSSNS